MTKILSKPTGMAETKITIDLFCSGSCSAYANSAGGYGAVLKYGQHTKNIRGGDESTTNNRMELQALIEALNSIKKPCTLRVHTSSTYVANGYKALGTWKSAGWKTKAGNQPKNLELWLAIIRAAERKGIDIVFEPIGKDARPEEYELAIDLAHISMIERDQKVTQARIAARGGDYRAVLGD